MAPENLDPEAMIQQLEARRAAFNTATDAAVSALRRLLEFGSIGVGVGSNGSPSASAVSVGPDEFYGLSVAEAAKKYLRNARRKMTNKEIADGLDALGYIHNSKDLPNNIGTALWRAEQSNDPDLFRHGRYWLLTEWTGGRKPTKPRKVSGEGNEAPQSTEVEGETGTDGEA